MLERRFAQKGKKMKVVLLMVSLVIVAGVTLHSENIVVPKTGKYIEINTSNDERITNLLKSQDSEVRKSSANEVIQKINRFNPVVLCLAGAVIFTDSDKYQGLKLFLIGRIRVAYDILRCEDNSVQDTRRVLDQIFVPVFIDYIKANDDEYKKANTEAIDFFEKNNEEYDQRWINLRGLNAMSAGLGGSNNDNPMSKPQNEWPGIKKDMIEKLKS